MCWRTVKRRMVGGGHRGSHGIRLHEVGSGGSQQGRKKVGRCQDGTMRSDPGSVFRQQVGHVISSSVFPPHVEPKTPNQHPADQQEVDVPHRWSRQLRSHQTNGSFVVCLD